MPTEKHSFEENLKELETVVRSLESGNVSLDEMLGLFERFHIRADDDHVIPSGF